MPADSDLPTPERPEPPLPELPRSYRPIGARIVAYLLVIGLAVVCVTAWSALGPEIRGRFTTFEKLTLGLFGAVILACVHALTRSRVSATRGGLVVINGYRRRDLDWAQVIAVRMPPGAPWASLDLADGSQIPAMGIQGSDGARARSAVHELRLLLAALS